MQFAVLTMLKRIEEHWPFDSPKIIEKLLAISFDQERGGFDVISRSVQGVDIEMVRQEERYALEVKTTTGHCVSIDKRDIEGLQQKARNDAYTPLIGALRISLLENWVLACADRIQAGEYTPRRLALFSVPKLESIANKQFERAVLELGEEVLNPPTGSPLKYLDAVLAKEAKSQEPARSGSAGGVRRKS
jgi:Holliday junction resolvase